MVPGCICWAAVLQGVHYVHGAHSQDTALAPKPNRPIAAHFEQVCISSWVRPRSTQNRRSGCGGQACAERQHPFTPDLGSLTVTRQQRDSGGMYGAATQSAHQNEIVCRNLHTQGGTQPCPKEPRHPGSDMPADTPYPAPSRNPGVFCADMRPQPTPGRRLHTVCRAPAGQGDTSA